MDWILQIDTGTYTNLKILIKNTNILIYYLMISNILNLEIVSINIWLKRLIKIYFIKYFLFIYIAIYFNIFSSVTHQIFLITIKRSLSYMN